VLDLVDADPVPGLQERLVRQAQVVLAVEVVARLDLPVQRVDEQLARGEPVRAGRGELRAGVVGPGLLLLDVDDAVALHPRVGVRRRERHVRVEPAVADDRPLDVARGQVRGEVVGVPVAGEVAVVDDDRLVEGQVVDRLQHGPARSQLVRSDLHDLRLGTALEEPLAQAEPGVVEVVAVAQEQHVVPAREHVDHVVDHRLALELHQELRDGVAGRGEAGADPRHRDHELRGHRRCIPSRHFSASQSTSSPTSASSR
jgi:hypothetical protein